MKASPGQHVSEGCSETRRLSAQADHRTGKEHALSLKGTFGFSSVVGRREVCDSQLVTYLPLGTKGYLPDSGSDSAFRGPSSKYSFHLSIQELYHSYHVPGSVLAVKGLHRLALMELTVEVE